MKETLKITLWNKEVGRLAWDTKRKLTYFTYNPDFLEGGMDIAPLYAPLNSIHSKLPIYGEDDKKFQKLPPFLADSLPDDWGNQLFEYWRAENKIPHAEITPLEKLSFIGKRGMGALEFEPESSTFYTKEKIDVQSLVELAQRIFTERENIHIRPDELMTMQALIAVGTSAGGRQPKAIIAINEATGEIRSGQISGMEGFDYYILKFGDSERSSAQLEMVYYEMCKLAGIQMMDSKLMNVEGNIHFLTKRFDRKDGNKIYTQTLAAIYPQADSYEKLLWVCRKMRLSEKCCEEVFRRMIFNILAHNTDDHNKNFTFTMNQTGQWNLSPAYDMTFIFNTGGFQPQEERCFMVRGKLTDITKQDVLDFAKDNGIRHPESIIKEVVRAVLPFRELAKKYQVEDVWITRIENCIQSHLSDWGYLTSPAKNIDSIEIKGHTITNARIEQAYKGNLHLYASIDGKEKKHIFRQGSKEYDIINENGITNISKLLLYEFVETFLLPKVK